MQRILTIVRANLSSIINAIDGTVIMTPDLQVRKVLPRAAARCLQSIQSPNKVCSASRMKC